MATNVTNAAETNLIKAAQMKKVREVDFVEQFGGNILPKLMEVIPGLVQTPQYEGVESVDGGKVNLNITMFVKNKSTAAALRRNHSEEVEKSRISRSNQEVRIRRSCNAHRCKAPERRSERHQNRLLYIPCNH